MNRCYCLCFLVLTLTTIHKTYALDATEQTIVAWVDEHQGQAVQLLEEHLQPTKTPQRRVKLQQLLTQMGQ